MLFLGLAEGVGIGYQVIGSFCCLVYRIMIFQSVVFIHNSSKVIRRKEEEKRKRERKEEGSTWIRKIANEVLLMGRWKM